MASLFSSRVRSNQPHRDGVGSASSQNLTSATAAAESPVAPDLRSLAFTDIFFDVGGKDFLIRRADVADAAMVPPPPEVMDDCQQLHREVIKRGRTEREFFLDYGGDRFRVARADTVEGAWFALRKAIHPIPPLERVGLNPELARYLLHQGRHGHGLILLSGETGQGKTTTACSLLVEYMTLFNELAVTVEDPPELRLQGRHGDAGYCWQLQVEKGDFATAIKRTMRYNPRYILLGEIRSPDEASEALRAAINGHLVISTIHAGSVQEAINALIKQIAGREPVDLARSILADGLLAVIQQRLLRGRNGIRVKTQFLVSGKSSGVKSKIREGKIEQLSTDIEAQANRVMSGMAPVGS